jgi:hypothetical protein
LAKPDFDKYADTRCGKTPENESEIMLCQGNQETQVGGVLSASCGKTKCDQGDIVLELTVREFLD